MEENVPTRRGFFGTLFVSATVAAAPKEASATLTPQAKPDIDVRNLYRSPGNYCVAPPATFWPSDRQKLMALQLHKSGHMSQSDLLNFIGAQR